MNWRFVAHIFVKEGREILRDRRTLFVNVILPVLLYPVLAMAFIQLNQLAQSGPEDWTRVALVHGDAAFIEDLPLIDEEEVDKIINRESLTDQQEPSPLTTNPDLQAGLRDPLVLVQLDDDEITWFEDTAIALRKAQAAVNDAQDQLQQHTDTAPDNSTNTQETEEQTTALDTILSAAQGDLAQAYSAAAAYLRERNIAIAVVTDVDALERHRYTVLADDAHRRFAISWPILRDRLNELLDERIDQALIAADLEPDTILNAHVQSNHQLAEQGERNRVFLAAIIPIILVMLALSGAFMPAIDLIAGERERGTLETLLSLPGAREDIFAGKLLVVAASAIINLLLNLTSLSVTASVVSSNIPHLEGSVLQGIDIGSILLALFLLLPLCLTLAAVCLGVAGLAASTKEAQNYLGPLFLVIMVPPMAAIIPTLGPSGVSDIIPILGPVLVIKEILQSPETPWGHILIATLASTAVAWVVIGWSARLLEQERFLFPGMVRAGWGRFRKWGPQPQAPSAIESLALFAACMGSFLAVSLFVGPILSPGYATMLAQIGGLLAPVLIHNYFGDYQSKQSLFLKAPDGRSLAVSIALIPIAILLSFSLGAVQAPFLPETSQHEAEMMEKIFQSIVDEGGIFLLLLIASITPGICEEFLCRGSLLSGLKKGLGVKGAIIISAVIFGLMHMSPARFLPQAVLGVLLAVLVLRSGSLWTAVIVHAGHNGLVILIALKAQELYGMEAEEELIKSSGGALTPLALLAAIVIGFAAWAILRPLPAIPKD